MKKIILDTDLGSDCDDTGALALLHNLQTEGKCELLAVMCNIANKFCPVSVKFINTWFSRPDIPIGQTDRDFVVDDPGCMVYTKHVAEEYLKENPVPKTENAVRLYRKILSKNNGVTVVSIGFLNNLADLIESTADDISPLSGKELFENSVSKVYIMGGDFRENTDRAEYNIRMDVVSAQKFTEAISTPVVYLGWETGVNITTGHSLWNGKAESPVKKAYDLFGTHYNEKNSDGTYDRPSWDPMTAWYAVTDDRSFMHESEKCTITIDDEGYQTVVPGGKDTYLILDNEKVAHEVIEHYIGIKK